MPPRPDNPSSKNRLHYWLIAILSAMLTGGIALFALSIILDERPPDISAFGPPPPAVAPGIICFNQAIAEVAKKIPGSLTDKYPPAILDRLRAEIQDMLNGKRENPYLFFIDEDYPMQEMAGGHRWEQDIADILLQAAVAAGLWQALDEALAAPDDPSFGWGDDKFGGLFRLSRWMTMQLRDELKKGDSAAALHSLRRLFWLGKKLEQNASTYGDWSVSLGIRSNACRLAGEILPELHAPPGLLCSIAADIGRFRPEAENARTAFLGEITLINRQKDTLWPDRKYKGMDRLKDNIIFKKNQTARLYGECCRDIMRLFAESAGNYAAIKPRADAHEQSWAARAKRAKKYIINKDGWYVMEPLSNCSGHMKYFYRTGALHSLAQAALALRAWQAGHDALPGTLEALVPACLPSVPIDYMDGNPIRYWKESGEIWTIRREDFKPEDDDLRKEYTFHLPPR
ncbi:MAG: hypothetical protein LBI02_10055 [Opitutaceae bacterium]|jgi:hypothetical protein|nr:hypothetical protein [Opitutaceae bacterium]